MNVPEVIYWRSVGGHHWVMVDVYPSSQVARWLAEHPGEIYDDGSGLRYRCDRTDKP